MRKLDINKFTDWLSHYGCEILPCSNDYEALRFRGNAVGVVYKSGKTSGLYTDKAILCFKNNKKWDGRPIKTGRKNSYRRQKAIILKRDGDNCFYCGNPLGDDITIEHLISLSSGGSNSISNMVLAHEGCNQAMNNRPIFQKVQYAINNRLK